MAVAAHWCVRVSGTIRDPLFGTWITQHTAAKQRAAMVAVSLIMSPALFFLGRALGLCTLPTGSAEEEKMEAIRESEIRPVPEA